MICAGILCAVCCSGAVVESSLLQREHEEYKRAAEGPKNEFHASPWVVRFKQALRAAPETDLGRRQALNDLMELYVAESDFRSALRINETLLAGSDVTVAEKARLYRNLASNALAAYYQKSKPLSLKEVQPYFAKAYFSLSEQKMTADAAAVYEEYANCFEIKMDLTFGTIKIPNAEVPETKASTDNKVDDSKKADVKPKVEEPKGEEPKKEEAPVAPQDPVTPK